MYIYIYIYIYIGILLLTLSKLFYEHFFKALIILSAISLPVKSPVVSAGFWIALFETLFDAFVVYFLALSKTLWLYYCSYF